MGYKNALRVLPADLLKAVQQHIDGEFIYIPRKIEHKKRWGDATNSRQSTRERNAAILSQYQGGLSVEDIARRSYLSPKTVYKILSDLKNQ